MYDIVLLPTSHYREVARKNWGLTQEQMKGMHVHHRIPVSKGGTNAPENLYVCSPSFHANIWHSGYYKLILNASEVSRLGGLARQKSGLTPEGLYKMKQSGHKVGITNKQKGIGLFARIPEKRIEDARRAGKLGIKATLAINPNHMRDMGIKGGAPGMSVKVCHQNSEFIFKSINKAVNYSGVSRALAYKALKEFNLYQENFYTLSLILL